MTTQASHEPLPATPRTSPQQRWKSPGLKTYEKWHHLTKICTEKIARLGAKMASTNWRHTTAVTFYLCLCSIWVALLAFLCCFIPLLPPNLYDSSEEHCAPDGTFRLEPFSLWEPAWFFQVVIGFGSLDFTVVKTIDIVWDVVVGRGGQTVLAYVSWKTFSKYLYSVMMTDPVAYQTFWIVFIQDGPSLRSIFLILRDFAWLRGLRSRTAMLFIILTMIFVLILPTLASSMTGYSASNDAMVKTDDINQVPFSELKRVLYVIEDGNRVNLSVQYPIVTSDDEYSACGSSDCVMTYIREYDRSQNRTSMWNGISLNSPTLDISCPQTSLAPFAYEHKVYSLEDLNQRAICQPVMDSIQHQVQYQWGFSIIQLEIALFLLMFWTVGIYIMWATAHLRFKDMGMQYNAPGNFKSAMSLADAIRKEFKQQSDKDIDSLTEQELMSFIKTHLNGGRVLVQSPPLIAERRAWKLIWKWVKSNKAQVVASLGILSLVSVGVVNIPL